jgi:hypothetical protein
MVRELTEFKGYTMVSKNKFRKDAGFILEFKAPYQHKDFHYTVGILANDDDLYIIELGCEEANYATHKSAMVALMNRIYKKEID